MLRTLGVAASALEHATLALELHAGANQTDGGNETDGGNDHTIEESMCHCLRTSILSELVTKEVCRRCT